MDMKLEVVVLPVADVDRAKNFYTALGWREDADYALVDTPPLASGADSVGVAAAVDGVVLVVDLAHNRRDQLEAARDQLANSNTRILGVVINRAKWPIVSYRDYEPTPATEEGIPEASSAS